MSEKRSGGKKSGETREKPLRLASRWQPPLANEAMFPGLLGEIVTALEATTEASSSAVAAEVLVALGNVIGRNVYTRVGETYHRGNENLLTVGPTCSRKGDAEAAADALFAEATPEWRRHCVKSGISSGEGVVHHVRDAVVVTDKKGDPVTIDNGVADKRLLIREGEASRMLKMCARDGSVLSTTLRDAWDGRSPLCTLTKHNPAIATDAHVSITGQITPADLRAYLTDLDAANGFANRFLHVAVARARVIANPPPLAPAVRGRLVEALRAVISHAADLREVCRTAVAETRYAAAYPDLTRERPGLPGALLARGAPHVVRLSVLFAVLAKGRAIDVPHLEAALAWWHFCERSIAVIFADRTGNAVADRIRLEMLPGQRMTFTEIRLHLFSGHVSGGELRDAVDLLIDLGDVTIHEEQSGGRPRIVVERLGREPGGTTCRDRPPGTRRPGRDPPRTAAGGPCPAGGVAGGSCRPDGGGPDA